MQVSSIVSNVLYYGVLSSAVRFISIIIIFKKMKTLTTQKSIVWSELKYVRATILKALFVANNKEKRCCVVRV